MKRNIINNTQNFIEFLARARRVTAARMLFGEIEEEAKKSSETPVLLTAGSSF